MTRYSHQAAVLARRVGIRPDELQPIVHDLLAFAYDAPEVLQQLMDDMNAIPLADSFPREVDGVPIRSFSPNTLSATLRSLALGAQAAANRIYDDAQRRGRNLKDQPIRLADGIHLIASVSDEPATLAEEVYYTPEQDAIAITLTALKSMALMMANRRISLDSAAFFPHAAIEEGSEYHYAMDPTTSIALIAAEELYHSYQYHEIFQLIQRMAKAAGVYDETLHGLENLQNAPTNTDLILLALQLVGSHPEAAALFEAYDDPAIKKLIAAPLEDHALIHTDPDYLDRNPFETGADCFVEHLALEWKVAPPMLTADKLTCACG